MEGAKTGEFTGLTFVATTGGNRYVTDVAGACYESPTFARGALVSLSEKLAGLIHRRDLKDAR